MTKPKAAAKNSASLRLEVDGESFDFKGETFKDCLDQIGKRRFKSKGLIRVERDDRKVELLMTPPRMRMLVYNDTFRAIMDKNLNNMLTI